MISLLYDISVFHNQNHIRLPDGGKPVGHDKARSPLHHGGKRFLNPNFRARIYGGGRLIQNQHRGQAEHHSGNTKELFLSLGKASAVLHDNRIIPLGNSLDKTV